MDCRLCGGRGHIQSRCPDTWRRYHATTTPNIGEEMNIFYVKCKFRRECDFRLEIILKSQQLYI